MPSGHGGGGHGGSHGGGGHSSGGSHFGGGRSGGLTHIYGPRVILVSGRPYRYGRVAYGALSLTRFLLVIMIFIAFFGFAFTFAGSNNIKTIKNDYNYYQLMISEAEELKDSGDSSHFVKGVIYSREYNSSANKYFIRYRIELTNPTSSAEYLYGYSYSVYNETEIKQFHNDQEIDIVVETSIITTETDSVPYDYKNMPLERDGEYLQAIRMKKTGIILLAVAGIGFVTSIVISTIVKKNAQKTLVEETSQGGTSSTSQKQTTPSEIKEEELICSYCGTRVKKTERRCPNCGARL